MVATYIFDRIAMLTRWKEWAEPKFAIYSMIICYIAVIDRKFTLGFISDLIPFVFFLILAITYGYVVNDYSDRELDKLAGKKKVIGELSGNKAAFIVISICALSFLTAVPLLNNLYFSYTLAVSYFFATFYSLPPIRFKERGLLGIITVTLSEEILSIMLIFTGLKHFVFLDMLLFSLYQLGFGIKEIAKHQIKDFYSDLRVGIATYTTERGTGKAWKVFIQMYAFERIILVLIMAWMGIQILPMVLLLLSYIAANAYTLLRRKKSDNYKDFLPKSLSGEGKTLGYIYPRLFIPLFLLIFTIEAPLLFSILFIVTGVFTYKLALVVLREIKKIYKNRGF